MPHFRRLLWLGGGLIALISVLLGIDRLALQHLRVDAERTAVDWGLHLARSVPELEDLLAGAPPSPGAQRALAAIGGTDGLFRFRLYDAHGKLIFVSDAPWNSVDGATMPSKPAGTTPPAVPAHVLAGANAVQLRHGNGLTLPTVYSQAYVPVFQSGRNTGVIEVFLDQSERAALTSASFRQAALLAAGALVASFCLGAALWRRRMVAERQVAEKLHYLSEHDPLTGTLNLPSFRARLEQACAQATADGQGLAVLTVDIDGFKDINERHGHAAGDRVLTQAADRLRGVTRGADTLARLGGDRFAVLQLGVEDSAAVTALSERILSVLAEPCELGPSQIQVTASVGAAILGVDGGTGELLTQHAELALLRARAQGRGGYSFYDPQLDAALQRRRQLAQDLEVALVSDQLQLHYQPLLNGKDGELLGYEALARWQHPLLGPISPGEFIPLAEESGLILALGRWVLNTACQEAARWPGALSVAVNLSAAQFQQGPTLIEEVRHALSSARLPAHRLELEITESLLMSHTGQVLQTLGALHQLGLKIGMDDFGTGYSSLAYLWRFPFDKLKIDRAFTQGLDTDPKVGLIVHSIVSLAHALGMRVNAEGVETEAQRQALCAHGCDELQGFLLGRPQPVGKLAHETSPKPEPVLV